MNLDPDPLHVHAADQAAWDEGYEHGVLDSLPPFFVVVLVGITAALLGGMVGWAVGMGLR